MINILFIHGLGSSSESSVGKYLGSLSNDGVTFYHPSFNIHPLKAMNEINNFIKEHNIDIVVGSSLGGFYALQSNCKYGVVVNPALEPINDIRNGIGVGEQKFKHSDGTYLLDDEFFNELETIIKRNYQDVDSWYAHYPKDRLFFGLFGNRDELFSHYEGFHLINSRDVILLGNMGHSLDKQDYPILVSMIETMIEEYKKEILEVNISRLDAIDKCVDLGDEFTKYFRKAFESSEFGFKKTYASKMQSMLNDVKRIRIDGKRQISFTQLFDWFFTKGSSVDIIYKDNEELQDAYNNFLRFIGNDDYNVMSALKSAKMLEGFKVSKLKSNLEYEETMDELGSHNLESSLKNVEKQDNKAFEINKVLDELKKVNPNGFINECHFQVEFGYALKRVYPEFDLTFEWANKRIYGKKGNRVDLFVTNGKQNIGFEFKYFTKEETRILNQGLRVQLKDQAAANLTRIGFWVDVEKLETCKSLGCINSGYCLLLTNDRRIFNVLNDDNMDKDYDVSNGVKPAYRTLQYFSNHGLIEERTVHILNEYELKNESYGSGLYLLVLPIK